MVMIHQRHGQTDERTDGQTTCDRKTTLCTIVHCAVKTKNLSSHIVLHIHAGSKLYNPVTLSVDLLNSGSMHAEDPQ